MVWYEHSYPKLIGMVLTAITHSDSVMALSSGEKGEKGSSFFTSNHFEVGRLSFLLLAPASLHRSGKSFWSQLSACT